MKRLFYIFISLSERKNVSSLSPSFVNNDRVTCFLTMKKVGEKRVVV
jgi:hypothetical protein